MQQKASGKGSLKLVVYFNAKKMYCSKIQQPLLQDFRLNNRNECVFAFYCIFIRKTREARSQRAEIAETWWWLFLRNPARNCLMLFFYVY